MTPKLHENIIVYAANVRLLEDDRLFQAAYRAVSETRRGRVDRAVFAEDKRLLLGAEILLRLMLKEAGVCIEVPEFVFSGEKKPYLKDRNNVFFSLSHSGEYVLCALSNVEVGCDIERIREVDTRIAKRFFCPEEYERIVSPKQCETVQDNFFRFWTLKESFLKATGRGMNMPMNSFLVDPDGERITIRQFAGDGTYIFSEYAGVAGYRCALCARCEERKTEFRVTDLRKFLGNGGK